MSNHVDPFRCFTLYLSIKTHFTNERYDALVHNGRIKTSREQFENRVDRNLFILLAKRFDSVQHAVSYFVANLAYGNTYPLHDFDQGFDNYNKWQRVRQSLTKTFMDDLDYLANSGLTLDGLLNAKDGMPPLFMLMKNRKVNIETVAILNKLNPFVDTWKQSHKIWKDDFLVIKKLGSFLKVDYDKFNKIYSNFKEALKENHETMA